MTRPARFAGVLLLLYTVFLTVALFSPSSNTQSGAVEWLTGELLDIGLPVATYSRLEVAMNAAIVIPVTFLGSVVLPRLSWRDWTAFGFLAALTVESVQRLLLQDRQATFSDVVANTAGALLGAVLYQCLHWEHRHGASR